MPTPPKRKPDSARRANRIIQQRTLLLLALLGIGTFLLLFAQLYKLQIKQHDELKTLAVRQQTLRTTVEASRGTIYDKNGDILALSSTAENVCVSPLDVAKNEQDQDLIANGLGEILGVDPSGILDDMKDTASQYKVIKKKVEQETADKVRVFISDNDIKGVFLEPTSKRYYPYSSLAAHVIGFVNKEIEYSTLALACYAFGQNFNVTPLSLINAQAACVNGGYLRTPYIVSEVLDQSGNVKYRHDTTPLRQVISENTSKTVREIMEYEVEHGTGKNGKVAGYRIGGKTGTADQIDGSVTVSFTCCAPADDPQIMMLLTLSNASDKTGTYRSGGNMAAPVASSIMAEILPYLGIEPTYSADELVGADHTVPNVVGLKRDEAATKLKEEGFSCRTVGDGETVTDQTPLGGAIVPNNAEIILYLGAEKSTELCIVPNVVGDSAAAANRKLTDAGLIMSVSGATGGSSASVRAISQSETPGTEVAAGTVVRVQFSDSSVTD